MCMGNYLEYPLGLLHLLSLLNPRLTLQSTLPFLESLMILELSRLHTHVHPRPK